MRIIAFLVFTMALAALACSPQVQQPAPSSTDGQPKPGGVLNIRDTAYYNNLDPTQALRGEASLIAGRVMEGLVAFKSSQGMDYDDLILEPSLAERWEAAPDGKSYTFHLRQGVKFQNVPPVNGRELTAADVKWSFEYISRTGQFKDVKFTRSNQINYQFEGLDRVDTPDRNTVVVRFKEPFAPFLSYAGNTDVYVTAKELYEQGIINDRPVGPGPWIADLDAWQGGSRMVFKKNPDYWQQGKPYVDEVRQLVIIDESSAMAAFQTKQLDIFGAARSTRDAEEIQRAVPQAAYVTAMGNNALRFYYNVKIPPFNDVRFRRAMSFAMDREEFVRNATGGKGRVGIDGGVSFMFTEAEAKQMAPFDPEQAKRLLQEAGYTGNPITIETLYTTAYGEQLLQDIQLLQAQWRKVGIDMKITTLERTDLSNRRRDGNYMMAPTGAGTGEAEPDFYMWFYFHPKSGANYYQVNDPKLTEYADGQRKEVDLEKRRALWREQAKYVHDNGFALWPYYAPVFLFQQPWVKGYTPVRARGGHPSPEVWLDNK